MVKAGEASEKGNEEEGERRILLKEYMLIDAGYGDIVTGECVGTFFIVPRGKNGNVIAAHVK